MASQQRTKDRRRAISRRNSRNAFLFLLPNLIGFLVFTFVPVVMAFVLAFTEWNGRGPFKFVGLKNFVNMWSDSNFTISLKNTLIYTIGTVPIIMIFAMLLSVIVFQLGKGSTLIRAMHFFPNISSIVAITVVWQFLYNKSLGPINQFLMSVGVENPPGWLSDKNWALPAVMIMIIWKSVGYYMVTYYAALIGIPDDLYEAASIDGATTFQQFWHITLPQLRPVNFYVLIVAIIASFTVFTPIYVMTQGGPGRATSVLVYYIYETAFVNYKHGYSSAMSIILFLLIFIFTLFQFRMQRLDSKEG